MHFFQIKKKKKSAGVTIPEQSYREYKIDISHKIDLDILV